MILTVLQTANANVSSQATSECNLKRIMGFDPKRPTRASALVSGRFSF